MKKVYITLLALGIAVLSGCQTMPKIQTESDSAVDLSKIETYAVLTNSKDIPGVDPGTLMRVRPIIANTTRSTMDAKGYVEVEDPEEADISVLVHGSVMPKTNITDWGYTPMYGTRGWYGGYPYYNGVGRDISIDQYNEGTLVFEVYDNKTKEMVWVGWSTRRITSKSEDRLPGALMSIINKFPSKG